MSQGGKRSNCGRKKDPDRKQQLYISARGSEIREATKEGTKKALQKVIHNFINQLIYERSKSSL